MRKERDATIDFLRGLAVVLMILIHVTVYFQSNTVARFLWNYAQIAVPLFVFCSSYLYFSQNKSPSFSFSYIIKRAKRLLIPYYWFVVAYFIFLVFIKQENLTLPTMKQWLLLQGTYDLDWLVVLFLWFLFILPFISFLEKKPFFFWSFGFISFFSSIVIFFYKIPIHFRLIMWLPWSFILFMTFLFVKHKNQRLFYVVTISVFLILFLLLGYILEARNRSLLLINNKYPPNIYFLSYGIFFTYLLYFIHHILRIKNVPIQPFFDFMSKYSYSIFFIHFLYLYGIRHFFHEEKLQWWGFFIILTLVSAGTQLVWNKKHYFFSILKKAKPL